MNATLSGGQIHYKIGDKDVMSTTTYYCGKDVQLKFCNREDDGPTLVLDMSREKLAAIAETIRIELALNATAVNANSR